MPFKYNATERIVTCKGPHEVAVHFSLQLVLLCFVTVQVKILLIQKVVTQYMSFSRVLNQESTPENDTSKFTHSLDLAGTITTNNNES